MTLTLQIGGDPQTPPTSAIEDRAYLIAQWHSATTQRDKARIETRLWEGRDDDLELPRRRWLPVLLGQNAFREFELRATLDARGSAAAPLWERIDSDGADQIGLHTAARLMRTAKDSAFRTNTTLHHAVLHALAEFDAAPMITRTAAGNMVRRLPPKPKLREARRGMYQLKQTPLADASRFWASLRTQAAEYMAGKFTSTNPDADPIVIERLVTEFSRDLKVLTEEYHGKINRALGTNRSAEIKRAQMIGACRTLSIDPPKPGKRVDLVLANKRKKMLARAYHPDSGTGATDQYQSVLDAYAVLEQYNEGVR